MQFNLVEPERFNVEIEPGAPPSIDHRLLIVIQAFDLEVTVRHPCCGQRGVVFADGFEVPIIRRATGYLDAHVRFNVINVFGQVQEGVVVLQSLRIIAKIGIGQIGGFRDVIDVAALIEEGAKHLWILHREIRGAAPTHAEALNASGLAIRDGSVGLIDVRDEFFDHHRLRHEAPITTVLIHGGASAIREDHDDLRQLPREDALVQNAGRIDAAGLIAAGSMQMINHRIAPLLVRRVARRQVDAVTDIPLHRIAAKRVMGHTRRKLRHWRCHPHVFSVCLVRLALTLRLLG